MLQELTALLLVTLTPNYELGNCQQAIANVQSKKPRVKSIKLLIVIL